MSIPHCEKHPWRFANKVPIGQEEVLSMKKCTHLFLLLLSLIFSVSQAWSKEERLLPSSKEGTVTSAKAKNGPGLLERNKLRYYLPPVDRRMRGRKAYSTN